MRAFHESHPLLYDQDGVVTIYSMAHCTACVCEDTSKQENKSARKVSLYFNDRTYSIFLYIKTEQLPAIRENIRQGMLSRSLVVISDNYRKTAIFDGSKLKKYAEGGL